jgi:hypothetical protein
VSASAAQQEIGWGPRPTDPSPLDLRFDTFTREHPDVLRALVWLAREAVTSQIAEGRTPRVGSKGLLERLRWRDFPVHAPTYVITAPSCDNSFASRFARKIAAEYADLAHVFELRDLTS